MQTNMFRAAIATAATAFSLALIAAPMAQAAPNNGQQYKPHEATINTNCADYTQRAAEMRGKAHDAFQSGDLAAYRAYNAEAARLQAAADQACSVF